MPGNRMGRINEEVQRAVSAMIRRLKDPRVSGAGMISVTRVETTSDLRYCKVYISVLDPLREKDTLRGLKSASGYMRRELGRTLGLRYTPQLEFYADQSISRGARTLNILRNVRYAEDSENQNNKTVKSPENRENQDNKTVESAEKRENQDNQDNKMAESPENRDNPGN